MTPLCLLRYVRPLVITVSVLSLAAGGHVIGGGNLPGPIVILILAAFILVPVVWLARHQLSLRSLLAVLAGGQLVLHEAFSVLATSGACHAADAGQSLDHGSPDCSVLGELLSPASHHTSFLAIVGHSLAVLATGWMLNKGEEAFWQLLVWLRPLAVLPRPAQVFARQSKVFVSILPVLPALWRTLRADPVRGPPSMGPAPALIPV